jgi:hypothetical protein
MKEQITTTESASTVASRRWRWMRASASSMPAGFTRDRSEQVSGLEEIEAVQCKTGYRTPLASLGTWISVHCPRIRNLKQRFESRVLPLFKRRTHQAQ